MIQEIIYTSAQSGLKSGSSGFCTVVCTAGMDQRTAQRLEGLSGYRHPFDINDDRNPVNFQHLTMRIGSNHTHVLSRICDAGPDHTGRSNKLAHHIAFTQPPSPSGPAHLFDVADLFVTKWDGKTEQRPSPNLPSRSVADSNLEAWAAITGDNGWAGHVAEQLLKSKQPLHILFSPGTATLPLLKEVLDVVSPARRWEITFSTYYTVPIAGAECQLRFVLDGTKEATRLRNDARAAIIDLTSPLEAATGGPLMAMARTGYVSHKTAPAKRATEAQKATTSQQDSDDVDEWIEPEPVSSAVTDHELRKQPGRPASDGIAPPPVAPNLFADRRKRKEQELAAAGQRSKIPLIVVAILLMVSAIGGGVWYHLQRSTAGSGEDMVASADNVAHATPANKAKEAEQNETDRIETADEQNSPPTNDVAIAETTVPTKTIVVEHEQKAEAKPVVEPPKDVFGNAFAPKDDQSAPIIRIAPWTEEGVTISLDTDAKLTLTLHHHHAGYDVSKTSETEWSVHAGQPVPTKVASILHDTTQNTLSITRIGIENSLPWAVLQIDSPDQTGFVLFNRPESYPPISLNTMLADHDATWNHQIRFNRPTNTSAEDTTEQHLRLIDRNSKLVAQNSLEINDISKNCELTAAGRKSVEFHIDSGIKHQEYRQRLQVSQNSAGAKIKYAVSISTNAVHALKGPPGLKLEEQLRRVSQWANSVYDNEEWEELKLRDDPYIKCSEVLTKSQKELSQFFAWPFSDFDVKRRKILHDLSDYPDDKKSNDLKNAEALFGNWPQSIAQTNTHAKAVIAAQRKLSKTHLLFSLHLRAWHLEADGTKRETLQIRGKEPRYQLRVPIVVFGNQKNRDTIDWQELLTQVDTPPPNKPPRDSKTKGRPQPVTPTSTPVENE